MFANSYGENAAGSRGVLWALDQGTSRTGRVASKIFVVRLPPYR